MSARLLCTTAGMPVFVAESTHVFGIFESTERFVQAGNNIGDWPGKFVILDVYDTSVASLVYLLEGDKEANPTTVDMEGILAQTGADIAINNRVRVSVFDLSIKFFIRG